MTVADDVAAVLDGFTEVTPDTPPPAEFEAAVRQMAAERAAAPPTPPATPVAAPDGLLIIAGQLTTIIHQNATVIDLLGAIGRRLEGTS